MKKSIYLMAVVGLFFFGLSSTTTVQGSNLSITFEQKVEQEMDAKGLCRWRTCYYKNGELVSCTEWTYAYCPDEAIK